MSIKDLKISTQLIIGFAVMMTFVVILGIEAYRQADRLQEQTNFIYNHPLRVRKAIGNLENDILKMRLGTRDLMLAVNENERQISIQSIDMAKADAFAQFDSINKSYPGNKTDITEAHDAFVAWNSAREINTQLASLGKIEKVKESVSENGNVGKLRNVMLKEIADIDRYASNKMDKLYTDSIILNDELNLKLAILILIILVLMTILSYIMIQNIRKPIKHLKSVADEFKAGNLGVRSTLNHKNEFGILSESFNSMIDFIQLNFELNQKTAKLINSMTAVDNAHTFFREMLPVLKDLTNSQMAAVYLLNEDKTRYNHYESVGLTTDAALNNFSASNFEGEFGGVLTTRKIQHVQSIPQDTTFIFKTVSGDFVPREIITIPIIAENEIIAIISIAGFRKYPEATVKLVDSVYNILTARIEGLLTYRRLRKLFKQIEIQNTELETQKTELDMQTVELKEQNRELEMQQILLNESNRMKTNFLSNMSHELRTPLNSVIALSGVLSRKLNNKINKEEYSYIEVIERNGKHLLSLINDILDISRIEAGKEEIEISHFSVENLIAELVEIIEPQAVQKNIKLIQNENNHNVFIYSDVHKCKHILQNLMANAVKFTEKGKVDITVVQHPEKIEINVSDTGIGIPEEHITHIFDEFRQADSSTSRRYGGTGLGLAIAKKYANLLGGEIEVKSEPNKGSVFTLVLPVRIQEKNNLSESENRFPKPEKRVPSIQKFHQTILLVDDSEPAIIQMDDFLTESGFKTIIAHSGTEALNIISKTIPDAIILDLMMPGVDGFEVLKNIRNAEETAGIPVLILTAKQITKDDLKFLKRNNVHQLIQKGDVKREELLWAVQNLFPIVPAVSLEPEKVTVKRQIIKGKPTVLVVEDNADNMTTVKAILADKFNIIEAINGIEAVEFARKHIPHLILMDIALPEMDGIQAFKQIRQNGELEHIPVIALTASAMTSDRETILAHGFDGYLAKPIDENEIFDTINEVLFGK
jgi:signal transduction histidine kinase/DNA-binding response OmpR family regulator/HAMP domain-containing protein